MKKYPRHSAVARSRKQWAWVRHEAKKRDGFKCTACGSRHRLEVHHVLPVRTHPLLAYELSNLSVLCSSCHGRVTRIEVGMGERSPAREAWAGLVDEMSKPSKKGNPNAAVG